jgi:hypothetical protein
MSNAHGLADPEWTPALQRYWAKRLPSIVIPSAKPPVEPPPAPVNLTSNALAHRIIAECASYCGIPEGALKSTSRSRDNTLGRNVAMYLVSKHTDLSHGQTAKIFRRDRTTITHMRTEGDADLAAGGTKYGAVIAHVEQKLGLR